MPLCLALASRAVFAEWQLEHSPCLFESASDPPAHSGITWSSSVAAVVRPAVSQATHKGFASKCLRLIACNVLPLVRSVVSSWRTCRPGALAMPERKTFSFILSARLQYINNQLDIMLPRPIIHTWRK